MGSPDRGAVLQHVLRRTLAVPARRQAFLDEVCGVNAEPTRRAAVTGWLTTHPTPRRLTSEDADDRRALVVSLADVLGGDTAARRLVAAARRALRRRVPPAAAILALAEEVRTGVAAPRAAATVGHGPADAVPAAVLEARWRRAEEDGDAAAALGCALTTATRVSRDADLPSELVVAMVTIGSPRERWGMETALGAVGRMTDAHEQARAVAGLAAATGDRPGWPWEHALATAERIAGGEPRATAVVALLPRLPPGRRQPVLRAALTAAATVAHPAPRERALATLAPHLPDALVAEALGAGASPEAHARVLAARARYASAPDRARSLSAVLARVAREADQGARTRALVWLAPALPATLVGRAVAVAQCLESDHASGHALLALALHVPADGLAPVRAAADVDQGTDRAGVVTALVRRHVADWHVLLGVTATVGDEPMLAGALVAMAPHVGAAQVGRAVALAGSVTDRTLRSQALAALSTASRPAPQARLLVDALALYSVGRDWRGTVELAALVPCPPTELLAEAVVAAGGRTDEADRARSLTAIAPHLPAAQQAAVVGAALDVARSVADEEGLVRALAAYAPHLPARRQVRALGQALTAAGAIVEEWRRAAALVDLVPALPAELHADGLIAARGLADLRHRVAVLDAIAAQLPPARGRAVLGEVGALFLQIPHRGMRLHVLQELTNPLAPEVARRALDAARRLPAGVSRAGWLMGLASHLPAEMMAAALAEIPGVGDGRDRAEGIRVLAPHVPPGLLDAALGLVRGDPDPEVRATGLVALAPHLPAPQQAGLLHEALSTADAIPDAWSRARSLTSLAVHLPPGAHPTAMGRALLAAATITHAPAYASAVAHLAARLPPGQPAGVVRTGLRAARAIANPRLRARALAGLVRHLPTDRRAAVWDEVVAATAQVTDEGGGPAGPGALAALAPWLPPQLLEDALRGTGAIPDEWVRGEALARLAPHLPAALLLPALRLACAITPDRARVQALAALAPGLGAAAAAIADRPALLRAWHAAVRAMAAHGRPALLSGLAALHPWAGAVLAPATLADLAAVVAAADS